MSKNISNIHELYSGVKDKLVTNLLLAKNKNDILFTVLKDGYDQDYIESLIDSLSYTNSGRLDVSELKKIAIELSSDETLDPYEKTGMIIKKYNSLFGYNKYAKDVFDRIHIEYMSSGLSRNEDKTKNYIKNIECITNIDAHILSTYKNALNIFPELGRSQFTNFIKAIEKNPNNINFDTLLRNNKIYIKKNKMSDFHKIVNEFIKKEKNSNILFSPENSVMLKYKASFFALKYSVNEFIHIFKPECVKFKDTADFYSFVLSLKTAKKHINFIGSANIQKIIDVVLKNNSEFIEVNRNLAAQYLYEFGFDAQKFNNNNGAYVFISNGVLCKSDANVDGSIFINDKNTVVVQLNDNLYLYNDYIEKYGYKNIKIDSIKNLSDINFISSEVER